MNLMLVERHEIDGSPRGGRIRLTDRRADHVRRVLRSSVGDRLRVGLIGGTRGQAHVAAIDDDSVELVLDLDDAPAPIPSIDLIVGLPRPQALHRVLQFATAFGIRRLHLTNAWRVEKSFFQSPSVTDEAIRRQLWLGAEQGATTHLPEVTKEPLLVPFLRHLDDAVPTTRLIAHPTADRTIEEVVPATIPTAERFLVAIGPEGGWIDRELTTFGEEGFVPVRLGPWILKVEAAVTATLAQLELLRRQHGAASVAC
ncbi:MAG: RsmE family RNA methyltransferase [Acidobacteriota bacterium]